MRVSAITITKLNKALATATLLWLWAGLAAAQVIEHTLPVTSLGQPLNVRIMLPPDYASDSAVRFPTLYINDGQDADAVGLAETLERLHREKRIAPVIVVAVPMLPDRMGIYGYSDRSAGVSLPAATRFGPVGSHAHEYSEWLALRLVPEIDRRYRTVREPAARTILGWSLGAANAFNIGWNYPEVFGRVGGFSPSFWLSAVAGDPSTAIVQSLIAQKPLPEGFSLWLAVGEAEEDGDRDADGVIDVMDDAQGVVEALSVKAPQAGPHDVKPDFQLTRFPGGQHNQQSWGRMLPEFLIWAYPVDSSPIPKPGKGRIERLQGFASQYISARNVDIWLPPGYSDTQKYAVLYMQDGQMLFDADITWNKQEWRADEVAAQLMAEGKVQPFIIVGIHNAGESRNSEYFPQKTFESLPKQRQDQVLNMTHADKSPLFNAGFSGDAYLKFLVEELKPYIDRNYSVHTSASNTAIMGSSRGGLISLYALMEYPEIFGSAASLSSHWPIKYDMDDNPYPDQYLRYMRDNLPDPATHRIYFDFGTATLDALYPPLQAKADAVMRDKGYTAANWQTRKFEGAEHNEQAWASRLDIPLQFLFPVK